MFSKSKSFLIFSSILIIYRTREVRGTGLQVRIKTGTDFCMVVPKEYRTRIGDSEYDGGSTVWCQGSKTSPDAPTFNGQFWRSVSVTTPRQGVIQMTGCINVNTCDRLRPDDDGGQYDSNGGEGSRGNPAGSSCDGYASYVELIEPSANRACIRCCSDPNDCPLTSDTAGCPSVIPGNYFNCN